MKGKALVVGVGNLLLKDEGFGVHVVRELENRYALPPELEVVDGGCLGLSLIDYLRDKDLAVVVDVVAESAPAGTLLVFDEEGLSRFEVLKPRSMHDFGLVEALRFAEFAGVFPRKLRVLAAVPRDLSPGLGLSPPLREALDRALEWLEAELNREGIPLRRREACV